MKILCYSTKEYDQKHLNDNNPYGYAIDYLDSALTEDTVKLSKGYHAICIFVNDQCNAAILKQSDIISLHCPLMPSTQHLINEKTLMHMKKSAIIVNTSRGGLLDTYAVIKALKQKKIEGLAIDVYEEEENLFFTDHSKEIIDDEIFEKLLTLPNVLVTGHQAFLTQEALDNIAATTLQNANQILNGQHCSNIVRVQATI